MRFGRTEKVLEAGAHIQSSTAQPQPPPTAQTGGKQVARNFAALALPEPVNRVSRFVAAIVLARGLTLHDYSLLNIGIAAAGLAMTFTTLGLPEIGARDIAVDHGIASWLAGRVLFARLAALLPVIGLSLAIGLALSATAIPIIVGSGAMALCAAGSAEWILRGTERMRRLGLATAAGGITVLLGSFAVAAFDRSAFAALAIFALGEAVASFLCWRAARPITVRLGSSGLRELVRRSWPVALSTIAFQAYYANLDTLIIAVTRSADEAGLYSAAYRVFLTLNVVSIFASMALLPSLARARQKGDRFLASSILTRSLWPLAGYGLAVLGGAELLSRPLMSDLFGPRFGDMGAVLVVLCIGLMWYVVGYPAGYAFIAGNQNRRFLAGAVAAASVDVALDLILIPLFGPIGAAAAMAAALCVACLIWLQLQDMRSAGKARLVLVLAVTSLGAITAEALHSTTTAIGAVSFGAGLCIAGSQLRSLL